MTYEALRESLGEASGDPAHFCHLRSEDYGQGERSGPNHASCDLVQTLKEGCVPVKAAATPMQSRVIATMIRQGRTPRAVSRGSIGCILYQYLISGP